MLKEARTLTLEEKYAKEVNVSLNIYSIIMNIVILAMVRAM